MSNTTIYSIYKHNNNNYPLIIIIIIKSHRQKKRRSHIIVMLNITMLCMGYQLIICYVLRKYWATV